MTEFLVALLALLPLFLAISYAARYADIQQRATQASRYAAFQRVMQPSEAKLSNDTLQDQMRARFFLAPLALNKGALQADDSAAKIKDATGQPALWADLGGKALLESPAQVKLMWGAEFALGGKVGEVTDKITGLIGKPYTGGRAAHVEVALFNKMSQAEKAPETLKIAATTAAAGNGFGSGGSGHTRATAAKMVPSALVPGIVNTALDLALGLFEPDAPEFGCVKADVVASHRLDGAPNNGSCS